jgi:hypothetical protein
MVRRFQLRYSKQHEEPIRLEDEGCQACQGWRVVHPQWFAESFGSQHRWLLAVRSQGLVEPIQIETRESLSSRARARCFMI